MADENEVKNQEATPEVPPAFSLDEQLAWRLKTRQEYEELFKLWKANELVELEKKNQETIQDGLQKLYEKYKESQRPPTHEELQTLLQQEYETFSVPVRYGKEKKTKLFTLVELPSDADRKFYNMFRNRLLAKASDFQALSQASMDMPFEQKLKAILSLFDDFFDVLAEACVICLNPYGDDDEVTREWVQKNLSSNRQWSIVEAQIGVNKLKDFFSRISQSGQSIQTMMTGVNFQTLQQLARS